MTLDSSLSTATWRDPTVPTEARVADLVARMTVREKVAQLYAVWLQVEEVGGQVAPRPHDEGAPLDWDELIRYGLGQVTRVFGTTPIPPGRGALRVAQLQRQIVAAGRFGIPAIVHEECLTGLETWQATIYPSPLCWGASFDPDLVEQIGAQIGRAMSRLGIHQGLAPVLDVARDLRWGRVEETIGEDPYLVGTIGSAYVRGLESAGVVATLKHFVGYSASRAGRNLAPVSIGRRELADVLLPPFEMALRAGARSVMSNYTDLDGVPVAADPTLLTDWLRGERGFTGTVVSDYYGVGFLKDLHGVAGTGAEAAALALHAGVDVELPSLNCYGEPLMEAVEAGRVDTALVDRAVRRVLRQKCELGLLDADWSPEPPVLRETGGPPAGERPQSTPTGEWPQSAPTGEWPQSAPTGEWPQSGPAVVLDDEPSRALARRLAARSMVLLRNDGVLPLRPGQRLAVIGPGTDDPGMMLGCYSFPRHVGVHHPDLPLGVTIPSVVDTLRADPAGYEIRAAHGCPVLGGDDEGIARAVATARDADVCVAVLGDRSGLFGVGTSGEGCDATDLRLPGRQEELLEALLATGTPVVLVLFVGRPYELSRQVDRLAAAVCAFFPGQEGARALADVLSGRVNPSGRLPVSFPAAGSSQPGTYLAPTLGHRSDVSTVDPTPVFPFGHGLSYTPATWLGVACRTGETWFTDGTCEVSVRVRNDAEFDTAEVVQVYLHDPVAEVARPVQQLIACARVDLAPAEARTVTFTLHADLTSYTGRAGRRLVEPGRVELRVGASSADIRATLPLTLTGPRREVGADRVMRPRVVLPPDD